ncbi:tetratricopeptide repeat protein [Rubellicoccus peritrichatus]|uniref:Tetratricopeptide repeat protein n=1 Tax=Rubellicoccus peritrichatus TaxID=3080537 RepID=A0AAQ3QW29_9BACT|nr:tetratricopeptide repeat protein [Puniceicoccus sp. CR14]WOO42213.1 tetratricopeptide repeat protein [Puniceicoccus sp. CR14]
MKFQTVQKLSVICLIVATLFMTGCGPSEESLQQARQKEVTDGLDTANRLLFSGQTDEAINRLEILDQENPNNPEILEALAFAYAKKPDHALAAFYFDTVVQLDPGRSDLALYAARSHSETDDPSSAARAYQAYLKDSPEDAAAWQALARNLAADNQRKQALNAFHEASNRSGNPPEALDAAIIGELYIDLENQAQAERWFEASLQMPSEEDSEQRAYLGLLELDLLGKNWAEAEKRLAQLDQVAPDALDNSPLAAARLELAQWRKAQDELQAQSQLNLAAVEPESPTPAESVEPEVPPAESTITIDRTGETISLADGEPTPLPDKVLPTAENPDGAIEEGDIEPTPLASVETVTPTPEPEPAPPAEPTMAELAAAAYEAEDFDEAVRLYQSALAEDPSSAPIYFELSRAYYKTESWPQSELYASEAMRRDPANLRYTVNFLRAIQKTQPRERLMAELIRAKERFPESSDVTLALARGYERIYNNRRNAIFLYEDFLNLAPAHPQADQVRQHLQTLRY